MTHDIVIRGGAIVDGTGGEPYIGDVAVDGGLITAVGGDIGPGRETIDATGLVVSPGFIDIHTHLDAQIGWDPLLTPVSWHGVTTVLMGNCGVTFAPCKPSDRETLAAMMETVEDIPREAILSGLPWDWEGYGGYLDAIERLKPAINVAGLVGHSAVRFYVMGERAVEEPATDEEKQRMAQIVAQSIDDGAVGFSSNRFPGHVLPDGRSIPGTFADHDEVLRIAREVGKRDALMQNVMDFNHPDMGNRDLLRQEAVEAGGRILFSYTIGASDAAGERATSFMNGLLEGDRDITAVSVPRGTGFVFGLQSRLPAYNIWGQKKFFGPAWESLAAMDFAERLAAVRDDGMRASLVEEARAANQEKLYWLEGVYWLGAGERPNYLAATADNLPALAERAGEHWSETFLRLTLETDGRCLFCWRMFSRNLPALKDWLGHERVIPGLSDAGAHVSQVMDSGVSSFILSYWVRQVGLYSLAEGVRRLTSAPARVIGVKDRGVLAPGMRADINVFDADGVGEQYPELVHDFPGGAPRYIQRSTGYHTTLVNGQVTFRDGVHSGARAGQVLRHAA
jgi:N-acyl-D-aspartate/D-glutamate deacylase